MKQFIYTLEHIYTDEDHTAIKLLGFFDDLTKLEKIKDQALKFPGFRDYPDGFLRIKNEMNKVHWKTGFTSIIGEVGRDYIPEKDEIDRGSSVVQNLTAIFSVSHIYTIDRYLDDERIIGVFSSLEEAQQNVDELKQQPGFKEHPEDFMVGEIELNKLLWTSGF
ncbi:hypothetical protein SAMN05421639_102807 [Chryseobacterium shigense]|uniref:DUF7336 domain-containing protein n=1 Tax=Chryseobacterium shigense TaxID=297244 RepID=A0A1N7IA44_9FLAO|nr:hypothetical protein [Chryseobacterium shigense]SIS33976.1 hypothetical protein SAMN05421639_102807 [Chryseobacterium shigense]